MTGYAVLTQGLTHRYAAHGEPVVADLDLAVPEGSIYGFLGANGAGKTTTLRLVLALLRRQHGTVHVLGKSLDHDRLAILRQVGSLIETPSVYGHLTARENLRVLQPLYQVPNRRLDDVLATVGLNEVGEKRVATFSLGMKQRLALAIALLHQPRLLILDEPTNGLDPHGIIEMRELLTQLHRDQGVTVLVSSHILAEVERLVTHIGIIARGRLRFQGTLAALMANRDREARVRFGTSDDEQAARVFGSFGVEASFADGRLLVPALSDEQLATCNRRLVEAGIAVHEIARVRGDLESVFREMVAQ